MKCDAEKRAMVNKTCASDEEIDEFLDKNVFLTLALNQVAIMD